MLSDEFRMALDSLRTRIFSSDFRNPYRMLDAGTYTDAFGTVTVTTSKSGVSAFPAEYGEKYTCVLKDTTIKNGTATVDCSPYTTSMHGYYNFAYGGVEKIVFSGDSYRHPVLYDPHVIIFPENVSGYINIVVSAYGLCKLYLPRHMTNFPSNWIIPKDSDEYGMLVTTSNLVLVQCPKDTDIQYIFLHVLPMTADTMVGIFNNLKDVSAEAVTYKVQVGSTNLAKLTTEQKNIAINKGWDLA